ncbi:MAG TPA: hypothetical protein VGN81_02745 [Pseudonocardiaceae bacterium]
MTLTAPAASSTGTEAGPERETRTEAGTAETGTVREAGQTFRREGRAAVLGETAEAAGAEAATAETATAVLVVFAVFVVPAGAAFADALAEGAAHVVERVVPGLSAWIEWIVTHG